MLCSLQVYSLLANPASVVTSGKGDAEAEMRANLKGR